MRAITVGLRNTMPALAFVAAAVAAASCGREPTGVRAGMAQASLNIGPLFQTTQGTSGDDVTLIKVTIYLVNPALPVTSPNRLKELKSLTFSIDDASRVTETDETVTLKVDFPLQAADAIYEVQGGAYDDNGNQLFAVQPVQFSGAQANSSGGATVSSTVTYVGPGSNAVRIEISPPELTLQPGQQGQFTAKVFAAGDVLIPIAPLRWQSFNGGVAHFPNDRSGTVQAGNPGSTQVTVDIEGLAVNATATVHVVRTPSSLTLVGGGNQTALAGSQLAQPIRVRVAGADNGPVSGVTVNFAVQSASGGMASPASAVTGTDGVAETRWTLGSAAGTQTLLVSAEGLPGLSVNATATAPPTSISIVSILQGNTPVNLAAIRTGAAVTVTARVTQNGQPLAGAMVAFSAGGASPGFSSATATTNTNGEASATFTATNAGSFTIMVTHQTGGSAGASAQTTVMVLNPATVTQLVKVSGDNQNVLAGSTFADPVVVEARNAFGEPVPDVDLQFTVSTGTSTLRTLSDGRVSVVLVVQAGSLLGAGTIVVRLASNPSITVTFAYTVVAP